MCARPCAGLPTGFFPALSVVVWVLLFLAVPYTLADTSGKAPSEQTVELINRTGTPLYGLFLAPSGSGSWSGDLLGGVRLDMGEGIDLAFPWGARAIWWDLRVENRQGQSVEWKNIPLRRFRQVTLYFQGNTPRVKAR